MKEIKEVTWRRLMWVGKTVNAEVIQDTSTTSPASFKRGERWLLIIQELWNGRLAVFPMNNNVPNPPKYATFDNHAELNKYFQTV